MWVFDPLGCPCIEYCIAIIIEEIPSCFVLNIFYGYFTLSKGPNEAVIWIMPIFIVIVVEMWIFDPPGVPIYI